MNILIISSSDPYHNAGRVALDVFNGLSSYKENNVRLLTKYCKTTDINIISFYTGIGIILQKIKRRLLSGNWRLNKKLALPEYHVQNYDQTKTFIGTSEILA